eukprot:TRINITY_DN17443_c0_g1_i2.p1 TRINITY_DN17443_c0_g1~~TRINITY_DN17443_c0_g1_i2.p1  ORF type:complete len:232 (-),score=56.05 TRINITY_DN17443_c0_g1_i2:24-719(-)
MPPVISGVLSESVLDEHESATLIAFRSPRGSHGLGARIRAAVLSGEELRHLSKGRTAQGTTCDCTDKPDSSQKAKGKKSNSAVVEELEAEREQAERANADKEMANAFGEFEQAQQDYDKGMQSLREVFKSYLKEEQRYQTDFWLLKAMHDSDCKALMDKFNGVEPECHKNWLTVRNEFFARSRSPQCVQGTSSAFQLQVSPLILALAPACWNSLSGRGAEGSSRDNLQSFL